jgi:hypothetical protein
MGREDFEQLGKGIVRRKSRRIVGLFIDGIGLDRATRRLDRKVDLPRLVKGVTSNAKLEVARYYTLIPHEDDARQFAFLDAVERSGLEVVVKRLLPIGVKRQVSVDIHIGVDLMAFAQGFFHKSTEEEETTERDIKRSAVIVCPSRELSYGIYMVSQVGVETSLADFGQYGSSSDGWKGVDRWIDLSTSETIWR